MKCTVTVIGLGDFGSTVALELTRLGYDVLGIDLNPKRTAAIADNLAQAVITDARDERVLRDLGVHESDVVLVGIGEYLEANILAALLGKNMPKPKVWANAYNHNHYCILDKLGVDHIVHPEHEMGLRVTRAFLLAQERPVIFGRSLDQGTMLKALAIAIISLFCVVIATFVLAITETGAFFDLAFEAISAFATVGLSRGITANLSHAGQVVIMLLMLVGRVGPLTLAFTLVNRQRAAIQYPPGQLNVG